MKCGKECEVYTRIVGYFRPVKQWNKGKAEEFRFRRTFSGKKLHEGKFKQNLSNDKTNPAKLISYNNGN